LHTPWERPTGIGMPALSRIGRHPAGVVELPLRSVSECFRENDVRTRRDYTAPPVGSSSGTGIGTGSSEGVASAQSPAIAPVFGIDTRVPLGGMRPLGNGRGQLEPALAPGSGRARSLSRSSANSEGSTGNNARSSSRGSAASDSRACEGNDSASPALTAGRLLESGRHRMLGRFVRPRPRNVFVASSPMRPAPIDAPKSDAPAGQGHAIRGVRRRLDRSPIESDSKGVIVRCLTGQSAILDLTDAEVVIMQFPADVFPANAEGKEGGSEMGSHDTLGGPGGYGTTSAATVSHRSVAWQVAELVGVLAFTDLPLFA